MIPYPATTGGPQFNSLLNRRSKRRNPIALRLPDGRASHEICNRITSAARRLLVHVAHRRLHVVKAHVGVHVGRDRGTGVT